jgi:hypothetical protein
MRGKKELLILIVIIAGLVAYLWTHKSDRVNYELPQVGELTTGKITRVEITTPDETINLTKSDGSWKVGQRPYPASQRLVDSMLDAISGLEVSALASQSKNYARYSLDEASAIRVKAWEGDSLARSFSIGKSASTQSNTFITLQDRPEIYLSEQNLRMTFDKSADMFRDKAVLSFSMDAVQSISLAKGADTLELKKEASEGEEAKKQVWKDSEGTDMADSEVKNLLRPLHALKCQSYIEDRDKEDFTNPELTISVQAEQTHTLHLFPQSGEGEELPYPATSSDSEYPFEISHFNGKDIVSAAHNLLGIEQAPEDGSAQNATSE